MNASFPPGRARLALSAMALLTVAGAALASPGGPICNVPADGYATVQAAVDDAGCATINVAAGSYAGVTISRTLTLNGAQVGVAGWTHPGGAAESTIGTITVQGADVVIDGFTISNAIPVGSSFGVVVRAAGSGAEIRNNRITGISTGGVGGINSAQGIYVENGPDDVSILHNEIASITSDRSAKGVFIGDSIAGNASLNVLIEDNHMSGITSVRGAYGVLANNHTGNGVTVRNNQISSLSGAWAHGVGLEGDTPGAVVERNTFQSLLAPGTDRIAVFFEANPSFATVQVHRNLLGMVTTDAVFGIALHPALTGATVNGECNWWGDPSGPSGAGSGTGMQVGTDIDFDPWLLAADVDGVCGSIPVDIRIKPARGAAAPSSPTSINLKKNKIDVAILSTATLDAPGQVDQATLRFGRTGNESSLLHCKAPKDLDDDGFDDLLCEFSISAAGFMCGDTVAYLTGELIDTTPISGSAPIVVVPCP